MPGVPGLLPAMAGLVPGAAALAPEPGADSVPGNQPQEGKTGPVKADSPVLAGEPGLPAWLVPAPGAGIARRQPSLWTGGRQAQAGMPVPRTPVALLSRSGSVAAGLLTGNASPAAQAGRQVFSHAIPLPALAGPAVEQPPAGASSRMALPIPPGLEAANGETGPPIPAGVVPVEHNGGQGPWPEKATGLDQPPGAGEAPADPNAAAAGNGSVRAPKLSFATRLTPAPATRHVAVGAPSAAPPPRPLTDHNRGGGSLAAGKLPAARSGWEPTAVADGDGPAVPPPRPVVPTGGEPAAAGEQTGAQRPGPDDHQPAALSRSGRVVAKPDPGAPALAPLPHPPAADASHRGTAEGAATSRPGRPAAPETAPEPGILARAPAAAREINLQVPTPRRSPVEIQVVERGGQVHVAVRTRESQPRESQLAVNLRDHLGSLVNRIEQQGYRAEIWTPGEARPAGLAHPREAGAQTTDARGNPFAGGQHHGDAPGGGHRQQQQQAQQPDWFQELEQHPEAEREFGKEVAQWLQLLRG